MFSYFLFTLFVASATFAGTTVQGQGLSGGLSEADVNDETIQLMAGTAVLGLGSEYGLVNVTTAHTQVVAGSLYHMTLEVTKTSASSPKVKRLTCKVKVHEQTWMGYLELTHYCCDLHV